MPLVLYSYFRSSAAFRVRIALNLKELRYEVAPVNLLHAEQRSASYLALNPQGLVPALQLEDGRMLSQSPAILEWLEARYPQPALLPADPFECARVRGWCAAIACDIHPLNNLRVLNYLTGPLGASEEQKITWYHHWLETGFVSLEKELAGTPFCHGAEPGMADVYLVPQVTNALRLRFDMTRFAKLHRIYEQCMQHDAFTRAHPDAQAN